MATINRYNKEFLSELTTIDRKKLYLTKKENPKMYDYIVIGYISKHFQSLGREIPFASLREDLKKERGAVSKKEMAKIKDFLGSSSVFKRLDESLVIDGYAKATIYGLSSDEIINAINASDKFIRRLEVVMNEVKKEFNPLHRETLINLLPDEYQKALRSHYK